MLSLNAWIYTVETLSWGEKIQQITRFLCVYVCAHAHRCASVWIWGYVWKPEVPIWVYSAITHHLSFWGSVSYRAWCSQIQLGWLATEPPGFTCPCFPRTRITSLPPYLHFYMDTWNWTHVPMLVWQELYQLRCLPLVSFLLHFQLIPIHQCYFPSDCPLSCGSQD